MAHNFFYEEELKEQPFKEIEVAYRKIIGILKNKNRQASIFATDNSENQLNVMATQPQSESIITDEIFRTSILLSIDEVAEIYQTIKLMFKEYENTFYKYQRLENLNESLQQKLSLQKINTEMQNKLTQYDFYNNELESTQNNSIQNSRNIEKKEYFAEAQKQSQKRVIQANIDKVKEIIKEITSLMKNFSGKLKVYTENIELQNQKATKYRKLFESVFDQIYTQQQEFFQEYKSMKEQIKEINRSIFFRVHCLEMDDQKQL